MLGGTDPDATFFNEATLSTAFRLGVRVLPGPAVFFADNQFPADQANIDQYGLQRVPDTGPEDAGNVVKLFQKIGPSVPLTHSFSGRYGWTTGILALNLVRGIVAYEPSDFDLLLDNPPPTCRPVRPR